jgi:hypothetical protein
MSLEEAILDKVRRLPLEQQEEVLRFADGLQQRPPVRRAPSRNFLGRTGWLDRLRVGIVDYDRMLFLGPYQA